MKTTDRRPPFDTLLVPFYRFAIRHPIVVLLALAAITGVFTAFISQLEIDTDFSNYLNRNDPAVIAADEASDRYGAQLRTMIIVEASDGLFNAETLSRIDALEDELEELSVVAEVDGPFNSTVIRGTETTITVSSIGPGGEAPATEEEIAAYREAAFADRTLPDYVVSTTGDAVAIYARPIDDVEMVPFAEAIEAVVNRYEADGLAISITGIPYMNLALGRSMRRDLGLFLPLVILAIVVVLYAAFRWRWGVLIPFAVVGLSVLWTLGLMAICSVPITILSFILPVVLMAIGIADGIHVLSRYREAADGGDKDAAILETMQSMQRPVVMTSLTTAAGFLSLLNAYMIPQRMFGLFTSAGILFAMILSLVLIPAMLRLVQVPPAKRVVRRSPMSTGLGAVVRGVIRARWFVLAGTIAVAAIFAGGISQIHIETSQRAFLGEDHPAVEALDRMDVLFSGGNQIVVEVDTHSADGLKNPALLEEIVALETFLMERGVKKTISLAGIVREMNQRFHADDPAYYAIPDDPRMVAQLLLLFTFQGGTLGSFALGDFSAGEIIGFHALKTGEEQAALVRDVSEYLDEHFDDAELVGSTRIQSSMFTSIARSQITSLFTSIAAAGILVIVLMSSVLAGLISLVPLLFTIVLTFGVMAYAGVSLDIATLMISSITIGIGIDYGIHYIERTREEMRRGSDRSTALVRAAETAGRGILFNALALAGGFAILLLSSFRGMRHFGLLVTMTMLISSAGALVVIPAILRAFRVSFDRRPRRTADEERENTAP
jgi:predicted RND superfamily exporter protein